VSENVGLGDKTALDAKGWGPCGFRKVKEGLQHLLKNMLDNAVLTLEIRGRSPLMGY